MNGHKPNAYKGIKEFPPYQYREFPKIVDGVTVNNADEEKVLRELKELEASPNANQSNRTHGKRSNPLQS